MKSALWNLDFVLRQVWGLDSEHEHDNLDPVQALKAQYQYSASINIWEFIFSTSRPNFVLIHIPMNKGEKSIGKILQTHWLRFTGRNSTILENDDHVCPMYVVYGLVPFLHLTSFSCRLYTPTSPLQWGHSWTTSLKHPVQNGIKEQGIQLKRSELRSGAHFGTSGSYLDRRVEMDPVNFISTSNSERAPPTRYYTILCGSTDESPMKFITNNEK